MRSPPHRHVSSLALVLGVVLAGAGPLHGQRTMQDALNQLFVFGEGDEALFLVGSAQLPATQVHGDHFIPAQIEANGAMLEFFGRTIAKNVSSFPIPTTVGSETYVFVDGVPTRTSNSFGPIVAERAQTLGRGRLSAGMTYTRLAFSELRGIDMRDLQFRFVHENVDFPPCDQIFGGDCSLWGTPLFENDVIDLLLDLDVQADVWTAFTSYGLTDWLDISVAVPVVALEMFGESRATIVVATGDDPNHFFGGTQENPELSATKTVRETTGGLGDVAARLKARLTRGDLWQVGVLTEVRMPTGREEDFLGSGEWNARAQLVFSGTLGDFAPHGGFGYEVRGSEFDEDEFKANIGFDQRLADWATLAIDLLGTFKTGERELVLPQPVELEAPFPRRVRLSNIPERRDDIVDGAIGFKIRATDGLFLLANAIIPLNEGGLRPDVAPTFGLEFTH
ncbi:MAG: hypothetical protein R3266_08275 [Gemmatimonadota bacterium]|nr:hypothetical protein [Gemmatimonadota bacterium]